MKQTHHLQTPRLLLAFTSFLLLLAFAVSATADPKASSKDLVTSPEPTHIQHYDTRLDFVEAAHVKAILDEMVEFLAAEGVKGPIKGNTKIIADERTNTLSILTHPDNLEFLQGRIKTLDVDVSRAPQPVKLETGTYALSYAKVNDIKSLLEEMVESFDAEWGQYQLKGNTKIIADERTNILYIYTTNPEGLQLLARTISTLDVEVPSKEGRYREVKPSKSVELD